MKTPLALITSACVLAGCSTTEPFNRGTTENTWQPGFVGSTGVTRGAAEEAPMNEERIQVPETPFEELDPNTGEPTGVPVDADQRQMSLADIPITEATPPVWTNGAWRTETEYLGPPWPIPDSW